MNNRFKKIRFSFEIFTSPFKNLRLKINFLHFPQIWSSKWCIKDEPKQNQLTSSDLTGSSVVSISTPPPHNNNNNNSTNNSNTPNNISTANGNGSSNNNSSYYDTHNVFPTSVNNNNNQDTILYDSITSISQAQNTLYAPSIGTAIGELIQFDYSMFC